MILFRARAALHTSDRGLNRSRTGRKRKEERWHGTRRSLSGGDAIPRTTSRRSRRFLAKSTVPIFGAHPQRQSQVVIILIFGTPNPLVGGSNPTGPTTCFFGPARRHGFCRIYRHIVFHDASRRPQSMKMHSRSAYDLSARAGSRPIYLDHESPLHRIRTVTFSSILGADWVLAETQSRRRLAHGPKLRRRK